MYSKSNKSKFNQWIFREKLIRILNLQYTKNLICTGYFAVYSWKIVLTGMVSWLISYIKIICHHKEQIKYHPKISLGPPFYDIVNSTMSFAKHQKAEEEIRRRGGKSKTEGKSQRLCCTSLKFDLPLFWKAWEIQTDKSL